MTRPSTRLSLSNGINEPLSDEGKPWALFVSVVNPHDIMYLNTDAPGQNVQDSGHLLMHPARAPYHPEFKPTWNVPLPKNLTQPFDEPGRAKAHGEFDKAWGYTLGRIPPEERNPVNRLLIRLYQPFAVFALRWRYVMVVLAAVAVLATVPVYLSLGSEFMPPLWEESILYMPMTLPGASIQTMKETIQSQDQVLMSFPEVASVFAKAGRAETATDPAPLEMIETTITLKPPDQWRSGMTPDQLTAEMDQALKEKLGSGRGGMGPLGFTNVWTLPIKNRIDMLSTGLRTPIGIKIFGPDLKEINRMVIERQRVEDHWVLKRVLLRAETSIPFPQIGRTFDFGIFYDDYAVNTGLPDSLFAAGGSTR